MQLDTRINPWSETGLAISPPFESCLFPIRFRCVRSILEEIDDRPRLMRVSSSSRLRSPCDKSLKDLRCSSSLDRPGPKLPGFMAQVAEAADEPFMSEIGSLLPIALWGRTVL